MACGSLDEEELRGGAVLVDFSVDAGAGRDAAIMFLGGSMAFSAGAAVAALSSLAYIPALIATSNACVCFGGMGVTVLPFNVGASVYIGAIT